MATPPISTPTWKNYASQQLSRLRELKTQTAADGDERLRLAVVGIGHELCGDDAVGLAVIEQLEHSAAVYSPAAEWLLINGGSAPENVTGALRRFHPDLVVLVDAAQMDEDAGTIRWLDWQQTRGLSASTHSLPPYMLALYLNHELGCEVALLGIQPQTNQVDQPLSLVAAQAAAEAAAGLLEIASFST